MSVKANARSIEGLALETWHLLTRAQQTALRRATTYIDTGRHRLPYDTHGRCLASLVNHELAGADRWLTLLGQLVRDAGVAETQRQAKRRYAARLRGQA